MRCFRRNLGFRGEPLREIVAEATGLPALLEHDVRAADVAEQELGATARRRGLRAGRDRHGHRRRHPTGGKARRGCNQGPRRARTHSCRPGGEQCSCGQRGCLERYASAAAIARRYAEAGGEPGLSAIDVIARRADDGSAARVWAEAVEALALAFTTCKFLLDPALIVLAGGLSEAGDALLGPVQKELAKLVLWREPPVVKLSPLGGRAGLVGAALLARRLV